MKSRGGDATLGLSTSSTASACRRASSTEARASAALGRPRRSIGPPRPSAAPWSARRTRWHGCFPGESARAVEPCALYNMIYVILYSHNTLGPSPTP